MPFQDPGVRRSYNIAYRQNYYRNHKLLYLQKSRLRNRTSRKYLEHLKRARSCEVRGESDFRCLDFHHSKSVEKLAGFSQLATDGAAISKLDRELQKCVVLCTNCLAKEHFKR